MRILGWLVYISINASGLKQKVSNLCEITLILSTVSSRSYENSLVPPSCVLFYTQRILILFVEI